MRINKFVAQATGLSRRAADRAISEGRVKINSATALLGSTIQETDVISLDDRRLSSSATVTLIVNKPVDYVSSRIGQGSKTVYDLIPAQYHNLKIVGRLDKDSSGLILLTNDGDFANQLTHPRYAKTKVYEIELSKPLQPLHQQMITDHGVMIEDGRSRLSLQKMDTDLRWQVTMSEGRNRQIRRTFEALGYSVNQLCRTSFGPYQLGQLAKTQVFKIVD